MPEGRAARAHFFTPSPLTPTTHLQNLPQLTGKVTFYELTLTNVYVFSCHPILPPPLQPVKFLNIPDKKQSSVCPKLTISLRFTVEMGLLA
jgi:hypothetical protein